MKKITGAILFLITLLATIPFSVRADGGMFYPKNYPVYENGQKAFIYYHEGIEDLVVQPSYQGQAKDFVWVIPTPTEPKVTKSSQSVFTALQKLTTPDTSYRTSDGVMNLSTKSSVEEDVRIIEEKTIDSYDIITLKASSETALSEWMKTNKYSFPEDRNYLLSDYINDGWYFVITKIRPEAETGAQNELNNGTITPLRFTFKSDKMIYPMKLTRVAMEQGAASTQPDTVSDSNSNSISNYYYNYGTDIIVYALSANRVGNSQLSTSWANWVKTKDIKKILAESIENNWIQSENKLFLTKMSRYTYANQIDDDIVMSDYQSNDIYPIPFYRHSYYWSNLLESFGITAGILLLSPLLFLFIIFSLKEKYDEKWIKKAKWFKVALLALFLALGILLLVMSWSYNQSFIHIIEEGSFVGAAIAFIIIETVLIIFTIKDFIRQKNITNNSLI